MQPATEIAVDLFDNWFDPIETEVRARARQFIEELIRGELDTALARPRYERSKMAGNEAGACVTGHRHGSRTRSLTGTFGPIEIAVPRARLTMPEGGTSEWKSQALRTYQRRTLAADALIASSYLAGTNTRRVRRALAALFGGTVGKDTVSRTWRKVKGNWDAWNSRSLVSNSRGLMDITTFPPGPVFCQGRTASAFCRRLVEEAVRQLGGLDILVSNAGRQQSRASIADVSDEEFDATMKTNIYAPFFIIKAALPNLRPGSAIIATTSEQAYDPSPGLYDYAQTKAATMNFIKSLAKQLGPKSIRVNGVAPGPIWTPLQISGGASEGNVVTFSATAPLGRPG